MTTVSNEERLARLEGAYEHLATKADVAELSGELKGELRELRGEIRGEKRMLATAIAAVALGLAALQVALKYVG